MTEKTFMVNYPKAVKSANSVFIFGIRTPFNSSAFYCMPRILEPVYNKYLSFIEATGSNPTISGITTFIQENITFHIAEKMLENNITSVKELIEPVYSASKTGFSLPLFDDELKYN